VDRATSALWASAVAASPISAAIASALIADGTADRIVRWKQEELTARTAIARAALPRIPAATCPASPHVWLPLPRPWRASTFAAAALSRGVVLSASDGFLPIAGATPRAVRICLGPPRSRDRLAEALKALADISASAPDLPATL
jgi:DNA-binding transcriptional MocR family regulator